MKASLSLVFVVVYALCIGQENQSITVERIWKNYEFYAKGVDGFRSMKDGVSYTKISEEKGKQSITKHSIIDPSATSKTLVTSEELQFKGTSLNVDDYFFDVNETKLLLTTETRSIYRHSFEAVYYLFDLTSKECKPLDPEHQPQLLAEYSPDGTKVSYIYKNDLFIKDLRSGNIRKLTKDGKRNKVINGTTDWVYEEEFGITKAYEWSPDSKYIAFLRFDEREVPEFKLTYYGDLYPELYTFKYPKAGEKNSIVTAHMISISNGKITPIPISEYEYIPRLKFSSTANQLILQTLNRHQNQLRYHLIDITGKKLQHRMFYEENSSTYIDIDNNLHILSDGKSIIRTSDKDGYNHIYRLTFEGQQEQITKGNWEVIEFLGINEENGNLFYSAAEQSAIQKGIYRIKLDGTEKKSITEETGQNDAEFTQGMKYFVHTHSDANTPQTILLRSADGTIISTLETNDVLKKKLSNLGLSTKAFTTFQSGTTDLHASIIKPKDFDTTKKYPVYMTIYGGPGHNEVLDGWDGNDYMYHQLLAQKGYIVVSVDPRGTQFRGSAFKKSTYLQLGKLETEDFINVAKELQKLPYVDPSRIGIQGWSYGGFMTSLAMTKGADVFKMGIAVAPVTNWRYYDNIYTERFMRTPQENAEGYDKNSPINFVQLLRGKYLLIHGSGDDNVHYQNTMEMVNALVKANKQFDLFIYPNRNHGIYGGNTRNHLFNMMLDYTLKNL